MLARLRRLAAGLGPALLAACAQLPAAPDPALLVCHAPRIADLPLGGARTFVTVHAAVDGKPADLLVDTGSESSMLTPEAALRLGLAPEEETATLLGVGGTLAAPYARVHAIEAGPAALPVQRVVLAPLNTPHGRLEGADGILGLDWLHRFDVEFDVAHARMALYPAGACTGGPGLPDASTIAIRQARAGLVLLPAYLDDRLLVALLDSGATSTTLNSDSPRASQLAPSGTDPVSRTVGIDGTVRIRREHWFGQLRIGRIVYPRPPIAITTVRVPVDLLLGLNWLRGTRVWLSYATNRLTMLPVGGS